MPSQKIKKKRAFTLTELLVVVIVIGVLAMVSLPKFSKVIETRKTTEAEEVMRAVRTEQERRCSLDKNYATDFAAFGGLLSSAITNPASGQRHNYDYTLIQDPNLGDGIEATTPQGSSWNYTLRIPSYADGRICCTGADCSKLNRDYPDCNTLPDIVVSTGCSTGVVTPPTPGGGSGGGSGGGTTTNCTPGDTETDYRQNDPCTGYTNTRTHTCNDDGNWGPWGPWKYKTTPSYRWTVTGPYETERIPCSACDDAVGVAAPSGECSEGDLPRHVVTHCKCDGCMVGNPPGPGKGDGKGDGKTSDFGQSFQIKEKNESGEGGGKGLVDPGTSDCSHITCLDPDETHACKGHGDMMSCVCIPVEQ